MKYIHYFKYENFWNYNPDFKERLSQFWTNQNFSSNSFKDIIMDLKVKMCPLNQFHQLNEELKKIVT